MAEEFQNGVCSSGSWWARGGYDGSVAAAAAATAMSSVTCSAAIGSDAGSYGWAAAAESKARLSSSGGGGGEESAASVSGGSTVTFQDSSVLKVQVSDPIVSSGFLMDSSMPMAGFGLSSPTIDWSQAFLRSSGRADQTSFNTMLQEDLSSKPYFRQEPAIETTQDPSMSLFKDMNQTFLLDSHLNSGGGDSGSYGFPSSLLQGLFEQDMKPQQSSTNYATATSSNYRMNQSSQATTWSRIPQFLKASSPKQQQQQQPTSHQLQFSNNTPFWNASSTSVDDMRLGFYSSPNTQFVPQTFEEKPNRSSITTVKTNSEGTRDSNVVTKKSGGEPAFKKPRIETPSPLPTFKVRKEKLGDRITALQQLVSPFGKTDTASVLYEAIEYIKFLHDQVNVLSTPYLKNGPPMQHQQDKSKDGEGPKQDLRSRGLCLVPISSTFPVANEPTTDVWTAAFGGAYR